MVEFKRKRLLTIPVLKLLEDVAVYVKITGPMHVGKAQKPDKDGKVKEPATLANVVDLTTGNECQLIISAVVKSVLTDEYPGDSYVNLCFSITKRKRQPGKAYNAFDIEEIEDPAASTVTKHPAGRRA